MNPFLYITINRKFRQKSWPIYFFHFKISAIIFEKGKLYPPIVTWSNAMSTIKHGLAEAQMSYKPIWVRITTIEQTLLLQDEKQKHIHFTPKITISTKTAPWIKWYIQYPEPSMNFVFSGGVRKPFCWTFPYPLYTVISSYATQLYEVWKISQTTDCTVEFMKWP